MAGPCITAIKLLGVTSLGLLTGSLSYSAYRVVPALIRDLNGKQEISTFDCLTNHLRNAQTLILLSRITNSALAILSSGLLATAFKYSVDWERHPYLVYAALAAPAALGALYANGYAVEKKLLKQVYTKKKEEDLDKSYIHVSDEESSSTSTPASTEANSPQITAETSLDDEIDVTLAKKSLTRDYESAKYAYTVSSGVAAFGFVVGAIGWVGDYFFL